MNRSKIASGKHSSRQIKKLNYHHNMKIQTYNNPLIGCYFDDAYGQTYRDILVLKLAVSYGWEDKDAQEAINASEEELEDEGYEFLADTVLEAEDYLNSLETRPFLYWQRHEGDFGLYPDVESAREECEFVSGMFRQEYPPEDYRGEWLHVNDHGNVTLYVREMINLCDYEDKEIWSLV